MNRAEANALLNEEKAGCHVTERKILAALRATGDLSGVGYWRAVAEYECPSNSAERMHQHLLSTARQTCMQAGIGLVDDAYAIEWAETMLAQNPRVAA